jgi:hypothetical protein
MRTASETKDGDHPILAAGSTGRSSFSIKPTYQGTQLFFLGKEKGDGKEKKRKGKEKGTQLFFLDAAARP